MSALHRGLCAIGMFAVVSVLIVMVLRVGFPLELEWMEGGVLHQAHRFAHGQPIYPTPSRDFVPFLYTPGLPILLGTLGKVFGISYALGRTISIVSCVAIGWAIWRALERAGKPVAHRWAALGLFASGYVFTFRWLDLARPDALTMALIVWALVLLRESRGSHRRAIVAGVLMALAFWTKQTAATFVVASGIGALFIAPRQLISYTLTIALIDGGGVLLGNALTEGLLWHYIYELHQSHAFNDERFEKKTWGMFVHAGFMVLIVAAIGVARLAVRIRKATADARRPMIDDGLYWGLMACTGLFVSAMGYATQWAEPNAFIPGVLMGSIAVGIVLPTKGRLSSICAGLVGAQIVFSLAVEPMYQPIQTGGWGKLRESYAWQDLSRSVPSASQREAAARLREEIETGGPILALQRPWWTVLAGGRGHVGSMGINDVLPEHRRDIQAALVRELREGRFERVWIEGEPPRWMLSALRDFQVAQRHHGDARVRPMSGYMSQAGMVTPYRADQILLTPVAARPTPAGTRVVADFESGRNDGFVVEGRAFGRRAMTGISRVFRTVGPHGGRYLYGSVAGGKLEAVGRARSPSFELPKGGSVRMLLGAMGNVGRLRVELIDTQDESRRVALPIPRAPRDLQSTTWDVPAAWAGSNVVIELEDAAKKGALFIDDLWVVEPAR